MKRLALALSFAIAFPVAHADDTTRAGDSARTTKTAATGTSAATTADTAAPTTASGIPLDADWKRAVYDWAARHAQHTAWGVAHAERNYALSLELARRENLEVDADVLFAAAFLHDVGAIEPHRKDGVDHAARSVELLATMLEPTGFPADKLPAVKAAILGHMYASDPGESAEARVFHDADTLDFLGAIGAARILSLSTRHPWAPSVADAAKTLRGFLTELPPTLETAAAKAIAEGRVTELEGFLDQLEAESLDGKAY